MASKSTRSKENKTTKSIKAKLKEIPFLKRSRESGFQQRPPKKINGKNLIIAFILMALQGTNTFEQWAAQLSFLTGERISKQGVWKRITACLVKFLLAVLQDALCGQMNNMHKQIKEQERFKKYNRILIGDSTVLALPDWLNRFFPGNVSRGKKKAQLKIQVVYDLLHNCFVHFAVTSFRDNDQSRAKDILSIATEKDLIIRDLGYFVLDCFEEMSIKNMSFLSRLRIGVTIYNSKTGQEINLMKELKQKGCFDQTVLLGRKQKLAVRLIALKVTQEQANLRRKKAKEDRDIRVNHSKEYYKMLDYQLFITTEGKDQFKPRQIAQIYNLRWRIESIFKCWKSHFHLQRLIPQDRSLTKERVETIVYLMLLFIVLFQVYIYQLVLLAAEKKENCIISLSKLCKYIAHHIHSFFEQPLKSLMPEILYYCRYDKRYDRKNYVQKVKLS